MSQPISFATWNLQWWTRSDASNQIKVDFIEAESWDLLALQEVTPKMASAVRAARIADVCVYPGDRNKEPFASALLARGGFSLEQVSLIAELPQPRRGISAVANKDGAEFDVLSWHAPNAAKRENRPVKRAGYMAFIKWASERRRPLLVGTDANHGSFYVREEDFPDSPMKRDFSHDEWWEENSWWTREPPELRDAWIEYLREQPEALRAVRENWTSGPSAVSYTRGSKKNPVPDRFDYVLVSPEFSIQQVAYDYEGGRAALSDHAFLNAELRLG